MPSTTPEDPPLLVAAVIRRGPNLLLVRQYGPDGPDSTWALPGGRCEPGELLLDALRREVAEETGLRVHEVKALAYVAQLDNPTEHRRDEHELPAPGTTATVLAFEVTVAPGEARVADPDGFVTRAEWHTEANAVSLLRQHPLSFTGVPAAARVAEAADTPPRVWQLRRSPSGIDTVIVGVGLPLSAP